MVVKKKAEVKETAQQRANKKYNATKRGEVVMRVQLTPSDDTAEWELIKAWLVKEGGNVKAGLYKLAKRNKIV